MNIVLLYVYACLFCENVQIYKSGDAYFSSHLIPKYLVNSYNISSTFGYEPTFLFYRYIVILVDKKLSSTS